MRTSSYYDVGFSVSTPHYSLIASDMALRRDFILSFCVLPAHMDKIQGTKLKTTESIPLYVFFDTDSHSESLYECSCC